MKKVFLGAIKMYNLEVADRLYNQMMNEDPDFANKLVNQWRKLMPEEFAKTIYCERYGKHIIDKEGYQTALSLIKGQNGRPPEIWSIEESEKILSNFIKDYDKEDFYRYDALAWLNIKRNDYPKITDEEEIAYIVYEDLHDEDYYSDPSERVYEWVEKHLKNKH